MITCINCGKPYNTITRCECSIKRASGSLKRTGYAAWREKRKEAAWKKVIRLGVKLQANGVIRQQILSELLKAGQDAKRLDDGLEPHNDRTERPEADHEH